MKIHLVDIDTDYVRDGKPSKFSWTNTNLGDGFYAVEIFPDGRTTWYGPTDFATMVKVSDELESKWRWLSKSMGMNGFDTGAVS